MQNENVVADFEWLNTVLFSSTLSSPRNNGTIFINSSNLCSPMDLK